MRGAKARPHGRGFPVFPSMRGEVGVGMRLVFNGTSPRSFSAPRLQQHPASLASREGGATIGSPYASRTVGWLDVKFTMVGAMIKLAAIFLSERGGEGGDEQRV